MASNADLARQSPNQGSGGGGGGGGGRTLPAAIQLHAPSIYRERSDAPANVAERDSHSGRDERTPLSPSRRAAGSSSHAPPPRRGKHWWLDFLPLPYALVAPPLLCEKVAQEEREQQQRHAPRNNRSSSDKHQDSHESKEDVDDHVSRRTRSAGGANLTRRPSPALSPCSAARVARVTGSSTAARACSDPGHPLALRQAKLNFLRHLFAELLGTLILTFAHAMLRVKELLHELSAGEDALFAGATLVSLIYALGEVSGAHFNPVVTLAFAARNMFPWQWILPYWLVQLGGALCAGALLRGFYGSEEAWRGTNFVSSASRFTDLSGMAFEVAITFVLLFVILSVAQRGRIIGVHAALAVGATIGVAVALGANITGGCMNPFRALGPAIVNGPLHSVWPCVAGPFIGGSLACAVSWLLAAEDPSPGRGAAMGVGKAEPEEER